MSEPDLREELKAMMVECLMLKMAPGDIDNDTPLFGPEGLGLDSIDALELVVSLEKRYGVVTPNSEVARKAFRSVTALAEHVAENRK